jgi:tetratricopeptide (TPR) repeat protein
VVFPPSASAGGVVTVSRVWSRRSALELRVEELMERVNRARGDHVRLVPILEEYLRLAEAHEDNPEGCFDTGAWAETLADSYLAVGRVDDAVGLISHATRRGHSEGAERLCELAEKLMRSGREPQARSLWQQARADFPDDVWIYVQAGIGYADLGEHDTALVWLTPGMELALRTGDPERALGQLVPLRSASLAATCATPDDLQMRAGRTLAGTTGEVGSE